MKNYHIIIFSILFFVLCGCNVPDIKKGSEQNTKQTIIYDFGENEHFNVNEISNSSFLNQTNEEPGFDTAKECVLYYLEGLRELDINKMLSAFVWNTQAEVLDLDNYIEYTYSYSLTSSYPVFPNKHPFLLSLNLERKRERIILGITSSVYSFLTQGTSISDPSTILSLKKVRETDSVYHISELFYVERLEQLATLTNIRVFTADEAVELGFLDTHYLTAEGVKKSLESRKSFMGMDELCDIVAVFSIGGEDYIIMPMVARYGNRWYLNDLSGVASAMMGMPHYQTAFCPLSEYSAQD